MSRTGGLGPAGQAIWPVRGSLLHNYGDVISASYVGKAWLSRLMKEPKSKLSPMGACYWLTGYRLWAVVVVEHGKGDMSLYGYNQSALVNVGQEVRAGQPIALVGSSGGQSDQHSILKSADKVKPKPTSG